MSKELNSLIAVIKEQNRINTRLVKAWESIAASIHSVTKIVVDKHEQEEKVKAERRRQAQLQEERRREIERRERAEEKKRRAERIKRETKIREQERRRKEREREKKLRRQFAKKTKPQGLQPI